MRVRQAVGVLAHGNVPMTYQLIAKHELNAVHRVRVAVNVPLWCTLVVRREAMGAQRVYSPWAFTQ